MKEILIFSTAYLPFVGGAEVAVREITNRLDDFKFSLITARLDSRLPRFERLGKADIYRIGIGSVFLDKFFFLPVFGFFKSLKLNRAKKFNLIWVIMASQASVPASFFKILNPKINLILTLQEGDEEKHLQRYALGSGILYNLFIRPWHKMIFRKADFVTAISSYLESRAIANGARCKIKIIPNAVDIRHFTKQYSENELSAMKNKINDYFNCAKGERSNFKFIITTSRLVIKNAIDDVIHSLEFLPKNIKFLVLGEGPNLEKLEKLTMELELEDRVLFLGQVEHDELPKYLKISDVFVRPSISEGLGNSFLEAMAAGIPVVATPVGGIPDFLLDPSNSLGQAPTGLFCEVCNPKSIAEKVNLLLENADLREKIIFNAREMVIKNYDWNLIAEKMKTIFLKFCTTYRD